MSHHSTDNRWESLRSCHVDLARRNGDSASADAAESEKNGVRFKFSKGIRYSGLSILHDLVRRLNGGNALAEAGMAVRQSHTGDQRCDFFR
jgi:hypothetical protein